MHDISTEKLFDLNNCKEYKLSIQLSLDGFSFSVQSLSEGLELVFKGTPVKISNEKFICRRFKEWLDNEELLQQKFNQVQIIFYTDKFTLVPDQIFGDEQKQNVIETVFGIGEEDFIAENLINDSNIKLLYVIPKNLKAEIQERFENVTLLHPVKLIIEKPEKTESGKQLVLYLNSKSFYFIIFSDGGLYLANSYKAVHPNDIVYYVLTALKQLNINPKQTYLYLGGENQAKKETESLLKNYLLGIQPFAINSAQSYQTQDENESQG